MTRLADPNSPLQMGLYAAARTVAPRGVLAAQPVAGTVQLVEGTDVTIRDDNTNELVTVHVSDDTFIRDMNPQPRVPTWELERIAYPGARVLAMAGPDRNAKVLRRNRY